jgi:tRNA A-37 threonylcarbamoyl transferase component Bud32
MSSDGANLVEVRAQGIRWLVPEKYRDRLLGRDGLRLEEWLHSGQARIIKHGPHRTVYRVALPELDFYLKHYRLMDARARIREYLRPAKARMEYERAVAVAQRQVPTFVPLGLGECPGPGDSFLVTRSLLDVEAFSSFLETTLLGFAAQRQAKLRQRVAEVLGKFLARVHDAGIIHRDLHAGNLLVRLEEGDRPAFYLVDLHDIRIRGTLSWRARRDNLVLLNRWFILRASRSDRLRFFRAYESALVVSRSELPRWDPDGPCQLEIQTWRSNLTFWRHRDRRCLATNRYYERVRSSAARGHAVRDLDRATLDDLLQNPDAPFLRADVDWLKDSPSSSVIEWQIPHGGAVRRVIYKRFKVVARSDPLTALVRRTPALRSWIFGHGLRDRCLPTPRPLLILHRKRLGLAYEGYLLTEKVDDALELHRASADLTDLRPASRLHVLRARIDRAARLVRELHRRNLSHRDLKAANILVQKKGKGSATAADDESMWLIDLVGVRRHWRLSRQRRVQNLSRLHASFHRPPILTRADKLRFLRTYFQWGLFGRNDWKTWWRQIERATLVKIDRNRRSGRALS